jgi:dihydrodipicolinate synthase/N-acetylneuraminate lyase
MTLNWHGVFPAATTQFTIDYGLDIPRTLRHLDAMIDAGVHGLILMGTVGECCSIEFDEKVDFLKAAVSHVSGRVPVLTGVAEYTTSLACRYSQAAEEAGVDGLMLLPAMVYKSDPRETIAHFRTVARAVDLPIICYNNPVSYGVDITPEMFDELADEPRFVAIKESSEDCRRITDLKNRCGDRYALFCGVDDIALECIMLGAVGWVSGLVNAFPAENRLLWDLAISGRYTEALELYRWFTPLLHLDTHPKLVQYIKLATAECGYGSETVRPPRLPLVEPERSQILSIIRLAIESRPVLAPHAVSAAS